MVVEDINVKCGKRDILKSIKEIKKKFLTIVYMIANINI